MRTKIKLFIFFGFAVCANRTHAQVNVLTHHNNNYRTGANLNETVLTADNVNVNQFGKVFERKVDDQIYAQPLIFSNITIPGHGVHNVVYCATVNNSIYAFDADVKSDSLPLWKISLNGTGRAPKNTDLTGACSGSYKDFSGNIGIVGTPVIDSASQTLYVVSRTLETNGTYVQRFNAIDITTGSHRPNSPVVISASVPGTGDGGSTVVFNSQRQNQRSGLLLVNGVVYISWAAHCDWGPYYGWIMGYDAKTLQQKCVYNAAPNASVGAGAGIWMAGAAPSADEAGNIYVITGNGTVGSGSNPSDLTNRGESILKLVPSGNTLKVLSFFTPRNYPTLEGNDWDLGGTGALLIPGTKLLCGGGKDGIMHVVNRDTMGGYNATQDNTVQSITLRKNNEFHTAPVYYLGRKYICVYVWCSNDSLKNFHLDPVTKKLILPPANKSTMTAAGVQGAMLSLSADGANTVTSIIWANQTLSGDAIHSVRPGILRAFDANNVANELWNSQQNAARDGFGNYSKFNQPTIANGKVYMATFSNKLVVYGLLNSVGIKESEVPGKVKIYPNPFSEQTTVMLDLKAGSDVQMVIYNSLGQEVSVLEKGYLHNGNYTYNVAISNRGVYFLKTTINGVPSIQKLIQIE
jgi:Secretion system C-terminal sorting domain